MRILVIRMLTWRWLDDVLALAAGTALTAAGCTYDDAPAVQTRGLGLQCGRMPDVRKPVFGRRILLPPAALLEGMR